MSAPPKLPPKPRFRDPRNARGFSDHYYPLAEGEPTPATAPDRRARRIQGEFQAAYYELNRAYADLRQIRKRKAGGVRARRERLQLQRIERALRRRDALENHYAPFGIAAEPVMRKGFAIGLRFTSGNLAHSGQNQAGQVELFRAEVPIPVPSDFSWDRLARGVRRALEIAW